MAKKSKPAEIPREGVNTRITKELREKLDAAATAAGRSTGSEIERRLERSFRIKDELLALFEDERTLHAVSAIAMTWIALENATGKPWYHNKDTIEAAQHAAHSIVGMLKPARDAAVVSETEKAVDEVAKSEAKRRLGMLLAEHVRRRIRRDPFDDDIDAAAISIADSLFDINGAQH